jgi:hypothetical protein
MEIVIRKYQSLGVLLGTLALLSCGRQATTSEKTTFTQLDSLTETYLTLQDTLHQSWNLLVKDEHEKLMAMEEVLHHLLMLPLSDPCLITSLQSRLTQFKQLHITAKTLSNPYVIEEHDFAAQSLTSELLSLSESNPAFLTNENLASLIDRIKIADQRTVLYRSDYDSIAQQFNTFLEKNKQLLKEIEKSGSLEKRPMFGVAANR